MPEINLQPTSPDPPLAAPAAPSLVAPLPRRFPLMTLGLAAVLLAMAAAQFVAGGAQLDWDHLGSPYGDWALGAKVPSLIAHGEYWRLVTANYLHASLGHLVCNLIPLALFGWLVETFYGRARLFAIYTLSGVAGAVVSYISTQAVSLGASTAVMGLVGAVLVHNWRYRHYLSPRVNNLYPLLVLGLVIQFGWDILNGQGIDVAGHVGGLLGGLAVTALVAGRILGRDQSERDWLPLPTALATAALLALYGAGGLLASLPGQLALIRAGQAESPADTAAALAVVVQHRPYFIEARLSHSAALLRTGRVDDAREAYLATSRQDPAIHRLSDAGRVRTAIARVYVNRGEIAYRSQDFEACVLLLRQAIDLDPEPETRAHAQNTYAWTLVDKLDRDYEEAEREVRRALVDRPNEAAYIDTLAWAYYKQGRYQAALSEQRRALEEMKKRPMGGAGEYYYHLAAIYEKLGRKDEAIENYKEALKALPGCPLSTEGLRRLAPKDPLLAPPPAQPPIRLLPDPAERRGLV